MTELRPSVGLCLGLVLLAACTVSDSGKLPLDGPRRDSIQTNTTMVGAAFSSDSRYIGHLDNRGTVRIWNVLRDKSEGQRDFMKFEVRSMAMGRSDRFAVAGPREVGVYDLQSGRIAKFKVDAGVDFMFFDEASANLAVAFDSGDVTVYSVMGQKTVRQIFAPPSLGDWKMVTGARFGVMYLFRDGAVRLRSCDANQVDLTVRLHRDTSAPISIALDGKSVAFVNKGGKVELRDLPDGKLCTTLANLPWKPEAMDLSPDRSVLAVGVRRRGVILWDIAKDEELDRYESQLWMDGGISFSRDGNFLAWIERSRKKVRFWSPVRGVVQWTENGPTLRAQAEKVCRDTATTVRYRTAMEPFARGVKQLHERLLQDALKSFAEVERILPSFPGLAVAKFEAEERHKAIELGPRLDSIEKAGDYHTALRMLDAFLRGSSRFDDYGFTKRADTLRRMLQLFDTAEKHRKEAREVDAVIAFEAAVRIVADLERHHPEYPEMRERVLKWLAVESKLAFKSADYERVISLHADLARLRTLSAAELLRLGEAQERQSNLESAERVYLEIKKNAPEYVASRRRIAHMARAAKDYPKARIHLELARLVAPKLVELAVEHAEVCHLAADYDAAIAAWEGVAQLEPVNPKAFEVIAGIEEERERWENAATALRAAISRSGRPRPKLLVKMAEVQAKAGKVKDALAAYFELIDLIEREPDSASFLGTAPRRRVKNWIRKLGFVQHGQDWIPYAQFLEEQGWERWGDEWLRPREARLREVAKRYQDVEKEKLRKFAGERYKASAEEQRITKGMTRREVIRAWGFFEDQNVWANSEATAVFEQLLFSRGRKVYLKDGLVCYWSE